jgi:hypothetical protein
MASADATALLVDERLVEVVSGYSQRTLSAVLAQNPAGCVWSSLGIWLCLAACATGADTRERQKLESALGCSSAEARTLMESALSIPAAALTLAMAAWVAAGDLTDDFARWADRLPAVDSRLMPTQQEADDWTRENTAGLIEAFPLPVGRARVALASVLATRVSWATTFNLSSPAEHWPSSSPWYNKVKTILSTTSPRHAGIVQTSAAGTVAVYEAVATDDLTVICVSAHPSSDRHDVLQAAHEVAGHLAEGSKLPTCSLFAVPLGAGHSWNIAERERVTSRPGQRRERVAEASLPAWSARGELDLKQSAKFGALPALEVLRRLVGPKPGDDTRAKHVAVATFTQSGFDAAAATAFMVMEASQRTGTELEIERIATLRFDHPFAAIAVLGRPESAPCRFSGLPLFAAWVAEPVDAVENGKP